MYIEWKSVEYQEGSWKEDCRQTEEQMDAKKFLGSVAWRRRATDREEWKRKIKEAKATTMMMMKVIIDLQ